MVCRTYKIEEMINNRLKQLYEIYNPNEWLWVVNFSGGKDSSALLTAVLNFAERNNFKVLVLHSDTTVEIPVVSRYIREILENIGKNDYVKTVVLDDVPNYFTVMLKRGYGFPRWNFRWCCRIYKYGRALRYLKKLGKVVNILGIRGDEGRAETFISIKGNIVTTFPLIDLGYIDVWMYLKDYCPWYDTLFELYKQGGRLGCWVCTVISDDLSLKHIDPDLYEIKIKLVKARCMGLKYFLAALAEAYRKRPDAFPKFTMPFDSKDASCRGRCFRCTVRKYWWYKNLRQIA